MFPNVFTKTVRKGWASLALSACLVALATGLVVGASYWGKAPAKHKPEIQNRGQLLLAAAAFVANVADSEGLTIASSKVVGEPVLEADGSAIVKVAYTVYNGDQKKSGVLAVILKRSLWIGRDLKPVK